MPPSTSTAPRGWLAHLTLVGLTALATFSVSCFTSMANPWFVYTLRGMGPWSGVLAVIELNTLLMLSTQRARRSVGLTVALSAWGALPIGAFVGFSALQ